ncbi:hypothetical protein [Arthrobacter gyeryongensis]
MRLRAAVNPFINMTPQLLQAAALILATLLFWHAWQWQKRKAQK